MSKENNNTMYKCSICGKQYSTVVERAKCELACVKQLEEEKKKAAEVKKNAERDARKKEVTDAIEHASELVNKYVADYGAYYYNGKNLKNSSDFLWPSKLFNYFL